MRSYFLFLCDAGSKRQQAAAEGGSGSTEQTGGTRKGAASAQRDATADAKHTCDSSVVAANDCSQDASSQQGGVGKRGRTEEEAPLSQRRPRRAGRSASPAVAPPTQERAKQTRAPKRPRATRVERGFKRRKLAEQIAISTTTVDRIVGGRYEWRVADYRRTEGGKRQRTIVFDDEG